MTKHKLLILFFVTIVITLVAVFGIHVFVLDLIQEPKFSNKIILSYGINISLASLIFTVIYGLKKKYKDQLGFFFIAGSFVKFVFFFVFFYPSFKVDGVINTQEFASFFIPYVLCLIIETFFMAKVLKKTDKNLL